MNKLRDINPETEYIGAGGHIYCKVCNYPKTGEFDGITFEGKCKCYIDQMIAEEQSRENARKAARIEYLKKQSDLGEKFINVTFESSKPITEHTKAIEYCNNISENYQFGKCLYLYGLMGRGKTHTLACILNRIAERLYVPYFTSFNNIVRDIREAQKYTSRMTDKEVFSFYTRDIDFLFIDDVGTEFLADSDGRTQQIIFDVVNKRMNNLKPTVFSSNFSIKELVKNGIDERIVWRLIESCEAIEFKGTNFRMGGAK